MAGIHKDFHGALSYAIRFLAEQYGREGRDAFLEGLAETVYQPLVEDLRRRGLVALEEHWQRVFQLEDGAFDMERDERMLVLRVHRCPAIAHMQAHDYPIADGYCAHTRVVNEAICRRAGYRCEVDYDQNDGRCVQRFWRDDR